MIYLIAGICLLAGWAAGFAAGCYCDRLDRHWREK